MSIRIEEGPSLLRMESWSVHLAHMKKRYVLLADIEGFNKCDQCAGPFNRFDHYRIRAQYPDHQMLSVCCSEACGRAFYGATLVELSLLSGKAVKQHDTPKGHS